MRRARAARLLAAAAVVAIAACGADRGPSISMIVERAPGTLSLAMSCSDNVSISVGESTTEVTIGVAAGEAIDGDCGGSAQVTLAAPLGNRTVVVDGETWVVRRDCAVPVVVPGDDARDPCPSIDG